MSTHCKCNFSSITHILGAGHTRIVSYYSTVLNPVRTLDRYTHWTVEEFLEASFIPRWPAIISLYMKVPASHTSYLTEISLIVSPILLPLGSNSGSYSHVREMWYGKIRMEIEHGLNQVLLVCPIKFLILNIFTTQDHVNTLLRSFSGPWGLNFNGFTANLSLFFVPVGVPAWF